MTNIGDASTEDISPRPFMSDHHTGADDELVEQ
jgi:hypothetical protein